MTDEQELRALLFQAAELPDSVQPPVQRLIERKRSPQSDGAAFDVATGRWHRIARVTGNVGFTKAITAWTGRQLFVTNGVTASCLGGGPATQCLPHAGLYDPATNRWQTTLLPKQMEGLESQPGLRPARTAARQ